MLRRSLLPTLPHSMNPKIIYLRGCNYELAYIDVTTTVVGRLAGSEACGWCYAITFLFILF